MHMKIQESKIHSTFAIAHLLEHIHTHRENLNMYKVHMCEKFPVNSVKLDTFTSQQAKS